MEHTSLQFFSKDQLLAFLAHTGNLCCIIDLKGFTLSSNFSEEELELAQKTYRARVMMENFIY